MTIDARPYQGIEEYGLIGDLSTVALVGTDGSIDFLCFPRFDSPSVFAALLDRTRGGRFALAPELDQVHRSQLYLPDTNVLLTRFLSPDGVAEVSDFMPVVEPGGTQCIVRRAKTVRGELRYRMLCAPRFDYGRADHSVELCDGGALLVSRGADATALRLRTTVPLSVVDGAVVSEFTLRAGESMPFVLEQARGAGDTPAAGADYVAEAFKSTVNFWRTWVGRSTYRGRWREMVNRSALALKLLTSRAHGSIVAAPTFGLPEAIGGERNWDYRYAWIRDASFTLYALIRLGFTDEAGAFMRWLESRCRERGPGDPLKIMYRVDGGTDLHEELLGQLEGYRGSRPVRIGNGAHDQLQIDIYGELMDAIYLYDKYGEPIHYDLWVDLIRLLDWVSANWRREDEGIWEVRGGRRAFLYSRLMSWVALDRGIRVARHRSYPGPIERWREVRDEIYRHIIADFWDPRQRAFVQHTGSTTLDASALLLPLVKFIGPSDPRWLSTLQAIERELVEDSLVFRYRVDEAAPDGLSGPEGTFSMCTFWYVECLSRAGDLQKARLIFEKMLGYANHLGLFAEELGPSGEHLGNYPQAFTHVALISAAYDLNRRLSAAGPGA